MSRLIDLTNQRFGRLTVLYRGETSNHGQTTWVCRCDCGVTKTIVAASLRNKLTISCGCYHKEVVSNMPQNHKLTDTVEYSLWQSMRKRCKSDRDKDYKYYKFKNIKVCERWDDFLLFYEDIHPLIQSFHINYPNDKPSIERLDNNKSYYLENIQIIKLEHQARNRSSNIIDSKQIADEIRLKFQAGKTRYELAEEYNCSYSNILAILQNRIWIQS